VAITTRNHSTKSRYYVNRNVSWYSIFCARVFVEDFVVQFDITKV